jgi:hypothetical protein
MYYRIQSTQKINQRYCRRQPWISNFQLSLFHLIHLSKVNGRSGMMFSTVDRDAERRRPFRSVLPKHGQCMDDLNQRLDGVVKVFVDDPEASPFFVA